VRICVDLDGVICMLKREGQSYADPEPLPGAAEKLRALRAEGHVIILHTARHMKTTGANVGAVVARVGHITLEWLARNGIEYDEIYFGKPWADVYIDDNALRFTSWNDIDGTGANLPRSQETARLELEAQ
jgi:capsule biosynthesis phosphatase